MSDDPHHRASSGRFSLSRGVAFAVLCGYLVWVVYPLLWVAYSSLKPDAEIFRDAFALRSADALMWENYSRAWREARFGDYFFNSLLVTSVSVTAIVLLGAMCAYALSRFYHPLGKATYWLFLAGLMIPVQLSIVPLFFELRALGLLDSRTGLILAYTANGLPFSIFILAGFFRALPASLYEAAVVDGCSEAGAFWRVMLPLARPRDGGDFSIHRNLEGVLFRIHVHLRSRWRGAHAAARARESVDHCAVPK
jgi:ABC-type glycerol-3-phosphate transport system permease component